MFDLGWSELFIIALVALIVVGPRELPRVLRTVSQALAKIKGLAREFQSGLDEMAREAELGDLKRQVENVSRGSLDKVLEDTVDPTGEVGKSIRDLKTGLNDDPLKDDAGKPAASAKPAEIARPDPDEEDASPLARKYKSIGQVFDPTAKASPSAEPTPPAGSSDKASS